jgi:hypothetical protein
LVLDGVPKIPASLAETAGRYGEYRSASLANWQPGKRGMLISTRFAATPQLHLVGQPGGDRHQLTFFTDAVRDGRSPSWTSRIGVTGGSPCGITILRADSCRQTGPAQVS